MMMTAAAEHCGALLAAGMTVTGRTNASSSPSSPQPSSSATPTTTTTMMAAVVNAEEANNALLDHNNESQPPTAMAMTMCSVSLLPKEADHAERKRPLAIQELLEKKRARLAHNGSGNGNGPMAMTLALAQQNGCHHGKKKRRDKNSCPPSTVSGNSNYNNTWLVGEMEIDDEEEGEREEGMEEEEENEDDGHGEDTGLAELVGHLCAGEHEDSETTSSSGSLANGFGGGGCSSGPCSSLLHQHHQQNGAAAVLRIAKAALAAAKSSSSCCSSTTSAATGELSLGQLLKRAMAGPMADPQLLLALQRQTNGCGGATTNGEANINGGDKRTTIATAAAANGSARTAATAKNGGRHHQSPSPAKATAAEVNESPLSKSVPHDRIFAQVPGRLSLLSNVVKYKMTVGEVKRRLMGPESFNFSLLGALLRRAKMPEKSQMLVDELSQVGLSIPRGRRRLSQVTLLSALTEAESVQFAKDFRKIAESEFPAEQMASEFLARQMRERQQKMRCGGGGESSNRNNGDDSDCRRRELRERLDKLTSALRVTSQFMELVQLDNSPVMDTNPESALSNEVQEPLCQFSMLTHGFGNPAIQVGVNCFLQFLKHQIRLIEAQLGGQ